MGKLKAIFRFNASRNQCCVSSKISEVRGRIPHYREDVNTTVLTIQKAEVSQAVLPENQAGEKDRFKTKLELPADTFPTKNLAERMNIPLKLNPGYSFREFGINE
jgi:hypothetical protein